MPYKYYFVSSNIGLLESYAGSSLATVRANLTGQVSSEVLEIAWPCKFGNGRGADILTP
jgi:hypothetical protein